jgi:hypothetical protein
VCLVACQSPRASLTNVLPVDCEKPTQADNKFSECVLCCNPPPPATWPHLHSLTACEASPDFCPTLQWRAGFVGAWSVFGCLDCVLGCLDCGCWCGGMPYPPSFGVLDGQCVA